MSLRHMLLGIIKDEPLSGYDLNKFFTHVIQYFWSADRSRIYRTLHQMHADGWVEIEYVAQDDSPDKKVYHITEAGRAALHTWLTAPDEPQPSRVPWLGKLFFGSDLPPDDLVAILERRIVSLQAELDELESRSEDPDALLAFIRDPNTPRRGRLGALTLDYGIAWGHFQIAWAQRAIAALRAGGAAPSAGETPASPAPSLPDQIPPIGTR